MWQFTTTQILPLYVAAATGVCSKVKTLFPGMVNIQEAQKPEYQNWHENSRILHFIEVAKIKEANRISQYVHRFKKQFYSKKQDLQQYLDHKEPQPDTDTAVT